MNKEELTEELQQFVGNELLVIEDRANRLKGLNEFIELAYEQLLNPNCKNPWHRIQLLLETYLDQSENDMDAIINRSNAVRQKIGWIYSELVSIQRNEVSDITDECKNLSSSRNQEQKADA